MALLDTTPPFTPQQLNIAGALQGPSVQSLQGGTAGQFDIADFARTFGQQGLVGGLSTAGDVTSQLASQIGPFGTAGGGIGFNIANLLSALGLGQAASGGGYLNAITQGLTTLGGGGAQTAGNLLQQATDIETSGNVPAGAQELIKNQLNDTLAAIHGKYAQLGMSGSTAEQREVDEAHSRSLASQFQIAQQMGSNLGQQALGFLGPNLAAFAQGGNLQGLIAQLGNQALERAGNLGTVLSSLGTTALGTAGSLGTTIGQLGLSALGLSSTDFTNLVSEALQSLGIQQGIFGGLASNQISADNNLTTAFGNFFKALAGNSGIFGTQGLIPGITGLLGSSALGGGGGEAAALSGAALAL